MFTCLVNQQGAISKITVSPALKEHKYALYVFAKKRGTSEFSRVKIFWYQRSNSFLFFADDDHEELAFRYFIKDENDKLVFNKYTGDVPKGRKIVALEKLDFKASFDVDVINDYVTPIKFQKLESSNKCYVLFNGALNRGFTVYPTFARHSWQDKINANMLNIYDSTITRTQDYVLGWYQGSANMPLEKDITAIINSLKRKCGMFNKDLVFYGSSGGGWAALKFASIFKGSYAVAINPQIEILKYHFKAAVDAFLLNSYGGLSQEQAKKKYGRRLAIDPSGFVVNSQLQRDAQSRFIIAQNLVDKPHYVEHFLPFWANFSQMQKDGWDDHHHNYSIIYDHPSGHGAEPPEIFKKIQTVLHEMISEC